MPSVSVSVPRSLAARNSKFFNMMARTVKTFNIYNSLDKFRTRQRSTDKTTIPRLRQSQPGHTFRAARWHICPAHGYIRIRIFNDAGRVDDKPQLAYGAERTDGRARVRPGHGRFAVRVHPPLLLITPTRLCTRKVTYPPHATSIPVRTVLPSWPPC